MTRYRMKGRPLQPVHDVLVGRSVYDEFEAALDPAYEQLLVDAGALEVLDDKEAEVEDDGTDGSTDGGTAGTDGTDGTDGWEDNGGAVEPESASVEPDPPVSTEAGEPAAE